MPNHPSGTVTFLFTDIEGSTTRWEQDAETMRLALARHDVLLRQAIEANAGTVFKTVGDAFCAAFVTAAEALHAGLAAQRAIAREVWSLNSAIRVRMALHTGAAEEREGDYFGQPLNRVARLLAAAHGGQILLSLATQELVWDSLPPGVTVADLGSHRLKDLIRPEHIFQVVAPDLPAHFPALKTLDARPNNLPIQPTPFIGRERDVHDVIDLLHRQDARLVTLTGPGGIGKTRLALQVAAEVLDWAADGAFFVSLAPILDQSLIAPTIATVLGVQESGGRTVIEMLKDSLRHQDLLLVFDNFEQVIEGGAVVAELLEAGPKVKAVVTSRIPLHVYGEEEYALSPLAIPDLKRLPSLERLTQYEAVALFLQRAEAVKREFQVTEENAPTLVEICYRLDGLPLALELAAARIKILPPQVLLQRLANRLQLLTGGARNLPARHQTLRAAIDWSYQLLRTDEQRLLARLAVFAGGCTLEAAESVCTTNGDSEMDVLEGIASLVDKSLLRQEGEEDPRFTMLETIREYALEQLISRGEERTRQAHLAYYLKLAEVAEPAVRSPDRGAWLVRLEQEHDNLRAALRFAVGTKQSERAVRLASALWRFWYFRGHLREGRDWLNLALGALDEAGGLDPLIRGKALFGAGVLAYYQGDIPTAEQLLRSSVELLRQSGDRIALGYGLVYLGLSKRTYEEARSPHEESVAIFRASADEWGLALAVLYIGVKGALQPGLETEVKPSLEEALARFRRMGDIWGTSAAVYYLALISHRSGDLAAARVLFEEAVGYFRQLGDKWRIANALLTLAEMAFAEGDLASVPDLLREALTLSRELGHREFAAESVAGLGVVSALNGQPEPMARLCGAVQKEAEASGGKPATRFIPGFDRIASEARTHMGNPMWTSLERQGRAMTFEEMCDLALSVTTS